MKGNQSLLPMTVATVWLANDSELVKGVEVRWAGKTTTIMVEDWKTARVWAILKAAEILPAAVVASIDVTVDDWDECAEDDEFLLALSAEEEDEHEIH